MTALFLSACAGPTPEQIDADRQIKVVAALKKAIDAVSQQPSWSDSADAQAARASFTTNVINVSFQGNAEELLTEFAKARGLRFAVTGPQPRMPIFIFVDARGQNPDNFLTDVDKQLGQRADVVLGDTTMELRYRLGSMIPVGTRIAESPTAMASRKPAPKFNADPR